MSPIPTDGFKTANEIHLPAGQPVEIGLDSDNVIHSFWVPQLAGKVDMIPGQHNVLRFTPETPGTYRGECAEFCGIEHARMGFLVIVQTPGDYARWVARQQPAPFPARQRGGTPKAQQVFMRESCAGCHTIRGTQASGHGRSRPDRLREPPARSEATRSPTRPTTWPAWISDAQIVQAGRPDAADPAERAVTSPTWWPTWRG